MSTPLPRLRTKIGFADLPARLSPANFPYMSRPVHAIAAVATGRVIGNAGRLPWSFAADTAYFMGMTRGGVMIEGPGCYAELGGALPDRETIVISRDLEKKFPGAMKASSLDEALALAERSAFPGPVWIAGGQWLYEEALSRCEKLCLTVISASYPGDRFFPDWSSTHPRLESSRSEIESGVALLFNVYSKS